MTLRSVVYRIKSHILSTSNLYRSTQAYNNIIIIAKEITIDGFDHYPLSHYSGHPWVFVHAGLDHVAIAITVTEHARTIDSKFFKSLNQILKVCELLCVEPSCT